MRNRRIIVGVVAAGLMVAGCGSSSKGGGATATTSSGAGTASIASPTTSGSASGNNASVDPCTLLTDADVTAGFALSDVGAPIDKVTKSKNVITPDTASCNFDWHAANDASSSFALYVYPASIYEGFKGGAAGSQTVPAIPGAYQNADGYFIEAGNITLSITGVESEAAVGKLFELAASKLG